mmetsp:Transcript_51555/g.167333  ORF Transcript_51555/g.167333 Transcript_51555/m.167333 type:complete len:210 (+) Transcript_51555:2575-3204(+)
MSSTSACLVASNNSCISWVPWSTNSRTTSSAAERATCCSSKPTTFANKWATSLCTAPCCASKAAQLVESCARLLCMLPCCASKPVKLAKSCATSLRNGARPSKAFKRLLSCSCCSSAADSSLSATSICMDRCSSSNLLHTSASIALSAVASCNSRRRRSISAESRLPWLETSSRKACASSTICLSRSGRSLRISSRTMLTKDCRPVTLS